MNVLSLFDGISCGMLALQRAGIPITNYYASEIDEFAIAVSKKNHPNIIHLGDINGWKDWKLPKIDIIIGGSPCQGFSFSGKCLNFDDPRSKLFFVFAEILKTYKPKYFLLENVVMKKECSDVITEFLGVEPIQINSALVSAQNRIRNYWTNIPNVTQPQDKHIYIDELFDGYSAAIRGRYVIEDGIKKTKQFIECRSDRKTNTLTTVRKDNVVTDKKHPKKTLAKDVNYRNLTAEECEKLQTLPIGYTKGIRESSRYKAIGNGWTVDVIVHILSFI